MEDLGPVSDEEAINYLLRCFTDKNSSYYKMIYSTINYEESSDW